MRPSSMRRRTNLTPARSIPAAATLDKGVQVVVGHDAWLTWIDVRTATLIQSVRLGGVFYEFKPIGHEDQVLVLHELGACRVGKNGMTVWAVDTDVVEACYLDGTGNLVLSVMDHARKVVVSMDSGRVL